MNTVLGAIDELTALSGNIGCILARWQKWSKVSLKGSEVRFRAAKKAKSVPKSSEVGCWAAKKANSVAIEGLWRGVVSE